MVLRQPDLGPAELIGFSFGHATDREAEHWLHEVVQPLGLPDVIACTHLVQAPYPHVAISVDASGDLPAELPSGPEQLRQAAEQAAAEHIARRSGRAVLFPGVKRLVGTLTVGEVLANSAIERVTLLGGPAPNRDTELDTRDFVVRSGRTVY